MIENIEMKITEKLAHHFGVDTCCLLFDSTNFFTFIDSFNENAPLAQRGHSKEKRDKLRIVGLALLASIDFNIPLFNNTYPGHRPDCIEFKGVIERLASRCIVLSFRRLLEIEPMPIIPSGDSQTNPITERLESNIEQTHHGRNNARQKPKDRFHIKPNKGNSERTISQGCRPIPSHEK